MKNGLLFLFFVTVFLIFPIFGNTQSAEYEIKNSGLTNVGYATFNLTADGFNCDGFFEATKNLNDLHIVFLYNTFGNNFSCLGRILNDDRLKTLEINLINEPGHRNGRLGSYEFLYGVGTVNEFNALMKSRDEKLHKKFSSYVLPLKVFLQENLRPQTTLLINPGLESNLKDVGGKVLVNWARNEFPEARIVWNPLLPSNRRRKSAGADLIEGHGPSPKINSPCVYDMDGTDVSYPNRPALGQPQHKEGVVENWIKSGNPLRAVLEKYANKCEVVFVWTAESNALNYKSNRFVDPRKRNNNISTEMYKTILKDVEYLHTYGKIYTPQ